MHTPLRTPLLTCLLLAPTVAFAAQGAPAAAPSAPSDYAAAMHHEHAADSTAPTPAATAEPAQPVAAAPVVYAKLGGSPVTGYLALPEHASGKLPGLIVIQEWWGLNDNIRAMTRRWAGEGYVALAVDLYDGKVGDNADQAMALVQRAMREPARLADNLKQAHDFLAARADVGKIGVIGWCFGGGWSLQTALALGNQVAAAVVYYGSPETDPGELAKLQAPLLGLYGALDKSNPVPTVRAMESELRKLGKPVTIVIYPDANHAFANPTGDRYNEKAASDAWQRATAFFAKYLKS